LLRRTFICQNVSLFPYHAQWELEAITFKELFVRCLFCLVL
jgi:hypothetical protein